MKKHTPATSPSARLMACTIALLMGLTLLDARGNPNVGADTISKAVECAVTPERNAIRIATFNTSLSHRQSGGMLTALRSGKLKRAHNIARAIQIIRPDIILLNEFDYDAELTAARVFLEKYLHVAHGNANPVHYAHIYSAASNTGVDSGVDLNNNGKTGDPGDALGFGEFQGQYGMLVLSRFAIEHKRVRTFQHFLWKDMPRALLPIDWYSSEAIDRLRLSSKSHWDVPVRVNGFDLHLLASHPTPPVFDGPEDRNGKRNHDEIRFWADYIRDDPAAAYMTDDAGHRAGIGPASTRFVIMGDLNADPVDGDSHQGAARLLMTHPMINNDLTPASNAGKRASDQQGGINRTHQGDPRWDSADFSDDKAGNLRVDYVLPSRAGLKLLCASVYWPTHEKVMSDHRPVYIDVILQ